MINKHSSGGGQNTTNPINNKKKVGKIILYILFIILILAIGSFAVYTANVPGTALNKLLVASPDFKFNFTESNSVTLNNPKNSDKQDFSFNVKGSSKEINYMFDIDYSIYLIINKDNTISNDKVYVQLFDKDNKKITEATTINKLTKVENKDNEYVLKTNNMILSNQTKTDNYILKYWYVSPTDIEYTKDNTSQTGTYKNNGIFNMTVNVSMNKFDYGKVESLSITTAPKKTAYNVGETFDPTGMVLQATLNNDTTKSITDTNDLKINPSTTLTASDTSITITYGGKTVTQAISVNRPDYALDFAKSKVGTDGLEQITHTIDNTLQVDNKFATEYRYRGGDSVVKNYVTFNNETWRIIGIIPTEDTSGKVENRFKIIKDESIGNMKWNSCTTSDGKKCDNTDKYLNDWTGATSNIYLNNDYYNTLSTDAKNMIGTTKYYLGGYRATNITTDTIWQYERKNEENKTGYYYGTNPVMQNDANKKIAIMYASDYGYAASKECTSNLASYGYSTNCKTTNNWLDKSQGTWFLPQRSDYSNTAFIVYSSGVVDNNNNNVGSYGYAVRPVLSLSSNVKISSGNGTSEQPYQLSIS